MVDYKIERKSPERKLRVQDKHMDATVGQPEELNKEKSKKKISTSKKIMLAILLGPKGGILLAPVMLKKLFPGLDITTFLLMKMGFGALIFSIYKKLKMGKKDLAPIDG